MELRHADNIATQILMLGGKPRWEFTLIDTKESMDEILVDHLAREIKSVQLYDTIIGFIDKESEDQLKLILKGIRAEEEHHFAEIKKLIEKRPS